MSFHKDRGNTHGNGRAGQNRDVFALPAGGGPLPAGLLNGVCCIEYDGVSGIAEDRDAAHVRNEGVGLC